MKVLNNLDLSSYQLLNAKIQNLASDPTINAANLSQIWYNSTTNLLKVSNGTTVDNLTNILESVSGTGAINVAAITGKNQVISIVAASGAVPGTMSAADYSKLAASTSANTASAIVQRDASGNFVAGTITAALTGTASNASALNNQAASFYLARANATGTQTASTISDLATVVQAYALSSFGVPTSSVAWNNQRITNLGDPVNPQDAATKNYVDATSAGFDVKASVRVATAAALPANTYSGGVLTASANAALTVDALAVAAGDRILVKNEATAANNGIYVVTNAGSGSVPWVLTRSSDANANSGSGYAGLNPGAFVFVEVGTANDATAWVMNTTGVITVGTTGITWSQVGSSTSYGAGNGINIAGSTISAVGTANRVTVGAGIDIAATYVGQTSITTLGTVATGTWNATAVGIAYGGTGATTAVAARTALGAVSKYSTLLATSATSYTVNHNLASQDVDVIVRDATTNALVMVDATCTDANNVTVTFGTAPAANAYRVVVIG